VKDMNFGMQALWDYVRKLGPLDKPDNTLQTMKTVLELLESDSPGKVHMARARLRAKIDELEGKK